MRFYVWAAGCAFGTQELQHMIQAACWGAANDRKHGKDEGEAHVNWARMTDHEDNLKEAIADDNVVRHLSRMASNAAWGAANERAFGKKSDAQVDWEMTRFHADKLKTLLNNDDLADNLKWAAFNYAWAASNMQAYGSEHAESKQSKQQADDHIASATRIAPKSWPMGDVQQLFWNAAWGATNSRVHKLARFTDFQYSLFHKQSEDREDWPRYHEYSKKVKTQLGKKNAEAYNHLDGMLVNAAWGAANERWYGKHSNSAIIHWKKFDYHFETGREVYRGPVEWSDIREMISGACWGAANERAYGASSDEAKAAWKRFQTHASRVGSHGEL
mmetsp:Transcript_42649/g.96012  ORF Transcript_42649/g.96012 Transcript_42649/m.96012 type:complete len:330 (-) Transcript_42649:1437-2426(-)